MRGGHDGQTHLLGRQMGKAVVVGERHEEALPRPVDDARHLDIDRLEDVLGARPRAPKPAGRSGSWCRRALLLRGWRWTRWLVEARSAPGRPQPERLALLDQALLTLQSQLAATIAVAGFETALSRAKSASGSVNASNHS